MCTHHRVRRETKARTETKALRDPRVRQVRRGSPAQRVILGRKEFRAGLRIRVRRAALDLRDSRARLDSQVRRGLGANKGVTASADRLRIQVQRAVQDLRAQLDPLVSPDSPDSRVRPGGRGRRVSQDQRGIRLQDSQAPLGQRGGRVVPGSPDSQATLVPLGQRGGRVAPGSPDSRARQARQGGRVLLAGRVAPGSLDSQAAPDSPDSQAHREP